MDQPSNPQSAMPPPGRIAEIVERAAELYHRSLQEGSAGRELLRQLGLCDQALIERHAIGYGDGGMLRTLPSRGRVREELLAVGLIAAADGRAPTERFAGWLTFPVRDSDGRTVSLCAESGRPEDPTATLPELPHPVWNAAVAKRYAEVLVTGSILDALALERAGIHNVAAAPAVVPEAELVHLEDMGARCLLLGTEAPGLPTTAAGSSPSRLHLCLRGRLRPLDFLARHGADALARAIHEALERLRSGPERPSGDLSLACGRRVYTCSATWRP